MDPGGVSLAVPEKTLLQIFLSMVSHNLDLSGSAAFHSLCNIL